MHIEFRKCGKREAGMPWFWIFKWGFGIWMGSRIFTVGHDTRGPVSGVKP